MTDYIYFIVPLLAVMTAALAWRHTGTRNARGAESHAAPADMMAAGQEVVDPSLSDAERQTRRLIGNEAYDNMTKVVDGILKHHRFDRSVTVMLTSGPENSEAAAELHRLLPGDSLCLRRTTDKGLDMINVYSKGLRIGRLMLGDADAVSAVMDSAVLTGCYVAEQNSYGDCDTSSVGIIVFHSSCEEFEARTADNDGRTPYKLTVDGPQRIVVYQN